MKFISDIIDSAVYTRFEPIEAAEWEVADSAQDVPAGDCDDDGYWVVFFVVQKEFAGPLLNEIGLSLEDFAGSVFDTGMLKEKRYAYIVVFSELHELRHGRDDVFDTLWQFCQRISADWEDRGCSLFRPKEFLEWDKPRAEKLMETFLKVKFPK